MPRDAEQPEFEFESHLPAGQQWFTLHWLAAHWGLTTQHLINLCDEGAFNVGNIAPVNHALHPDKTRATTRIPRGSVVAYLNARKKDL